MTDEEKLRLNQLMIDLDEFEKDKDKDKKKIIEEEIQDNDTIIAEYNPQAVKLAQGDGFVPDQGESNRLKQIDFILRLIRTMIRYFSLFFIKCHLLDGHKI